MFRKRNKNVRQFTTPSSRDAARATIAFQLISYGVSVVDALEISKFKKLEEVVGTIEIARRRGDTPRDITEDLSLFCPKTSHEAPALEPGWWMLPNESLRSRNLGHLISLPRSIKDVISIIERDENSKQLFFTDEVQSA